jgi:hypothetical protein
LETKIKFKDGKRKRKKLKHFKTVAELEQERKDAVIPEDDMIEGDIFDNVT